MPELPDVEGFRLYMSHHAACKLERWLTSQRGVRDPTCPRCGTAIRRTPIAGRTSYWCPSCQPARP